MNCDSEPESLKHLGDCNPISNWLSRTRFGPEYPCSGDNKAQGKFKNYYALCGRSFTITLRPILKHMYQWIIWQYIDYSRCTFSYWR